MDNTALITGGTSGIGYALAILHAERGGDLVLVARNEEKLERVAHELNEKYGVRVKVIVADLSEIDAANTVYQQVKADNIDINILINNAGVSKYGLFEESDWLDNYRIMHTNIVSLIQLCHLFLPDFIERNEGAILNVSSVAALVPSSHVSLYHASKSCVSSFTNGLWCELKDTNVRITNLMPGPSDTNFARNSNAEKSRVFSSRLADPMDVARTGYEAMLKGKLNVFAGVSVWSRVLLFLKPFFPLKRSLRIMDHLQKPKN